MKEKVRVVELSKTRSEKLIRHARQEATRAVEQGLNDATAYRNAQKVIESHRDLKLDKLVVTR